MGSNLEARKLGIIEYLAEVEDESIIQQIENLLAPKVDFWQELTDTEKEIIHQGVKDLDSNRRVAYRAFMDKHRTKK